MAELKAIKKVDPTEGRKRERKDVPIKYIVPEPFKKAWWVTKVIAMIPLSIITGIFYGVVTGFVTGLENTLRIFKGEMEK